MTLACGRSIHPILASKLTETTFEPLDDKDGELTAQEAYSVLKRCSGGTSALLVGPGLGQSGYLQAFMKALLAGLTTNPRRSRAVALRAVIIMRTD